MLKWYINFDGNRRNDESNEEDDEEDDDDDEEQSDKIDNTGGRRAPAIMVTPKGIPQVTRTSKKYPLECYVCAFKSETPLRACLDPTKYR